MSKNQHKEKSSFWKKLGLGKNKSSVTSLKSEFQRSQDDAISIKSKRASTIFSSPPPTPKPSTSMKHQVDDKKTMLLQKAKKIPTSAAQADLKAVDISSSYEPIPAPTTDLHNKQHSNESHDSTKEIEQKDIIATINSTEQPNVTPKQYQESDDNNLDEQATNKSISSFVILDNTSSNELLNVISSLRQELEQERATVSALQKQKEAVAKDLDYFELTMDELLAEKTDLLQQLEDEKIKSQHHLDDLNMVMDKMKSTADNARDQSFAIHQTKLEFEAYQAKAEQEKQTLMSEMDEKEHTIRELKFKLSKSQEQSETLKETIDQLVKAHTAEMGRTTAQLQQLQLEQQQQQQLQLQQQQQEQQQQQQIQRQNQNDKDSQSHTWSLHTPHGSPRIQPDSHQGEQNLYDNSSIYGSTPQSMARTDSSDRYRTPKGSIDYIDDFDLDERLMKLTKEKEELQSEYSKIPLTGGGLQARKRKEELEQKLDHVDSQLSRIKQKIRRS
ncbi:hypothetical protein [Parasitella parasitica]|uniref:Enkurin domain-containing protein n=1 Tax=Parasitella parasitica TaxID=35722 RepID=A0A0B7NMP5_9FUNG|nr:hypothetical protein [Parasitella parasitica]